MPQACLARVDVVRSSNLKEAEREDARRVQRKICREMDEQRTAGHCAGVAASGLPAAAAYFLAGSHTLAQVDA
jgi:hypothetical protein